MSARLTREGAADAPPAGHTRLTHVGGRDIEMRVMFSQSTAYLGADTMMHTQLMRYLDRSRVEVHVALNRDGGQQTGMLDANAYIRAIPDITIRETTFGPSILQKPFTEVIRLAPQGVPAVPSLAGLAWYIRRNKIDIIHGTEKPRDAFYNVVLGKLTGAKSVVHVHVKWNTWISPLVRWALRNADGVIGVSPFVAESCVRDGGVRPDRAYALVNCIEPERWDHTIDGSAVRREFGLTERTPVIGILARIFPWKGHAELLKALVLVKRQIPDVTLLIVGEDDPRSTPGRALHSVEVRRLVDELDLAENVIFAGFRTDMPQVMAALDVYTMPSFEEPCAVVYLEAMAMRKPIVALDSGGTPAEVIDGETGFLVPPGTIDQMADRIVRLLKDAELRRTMGLNGRERVEQQLNARKMAENAETIYRTIMARRGRPRHAYRTGADRLLVS